MTKESVFENFKWSVQALALPAEIQIKLFPDFVIITDELILEYWNWMEVMLSSFKTELSEKQITQIELLNKLIDNIPELNLTIPEVEILRSEICFQQIRNAAFLVLFEFSWQLIEPPLNRTTYIKSS